jgi:hypothetical protein
VTDRSAAGRKAKRHGAEAEYELIRLLKERGFSVLKVRNKPYDLVYWDGTQIYFAQVKSYVLAPKDLQKAQGLLEDTTLPRGSIAEVWMKNRKKGCRMNRGEPKKWIVEIGKGGDATNGQA